jgi:hypothetical protein
MDKDVQEILGEVSGLLDLVGNKSTPEDVLTVLQNYVQTKRLEFVQPQGDCV